MGEDATTWRELVEPHSGFVADFGFEAVDLDEGSFWSLWVQYRSPTAAIRISKSREFVRCEVELIRLVDGEVPAYPIWITEDRIDWVLLDNVVAVRRPDLLGRGHTAVRTRGLPGGRSAAVLGRSAPRGCRRLPGR